MKIAETTKRLYNVEKINVITNQIKNVAEK